MKKCLQVFFSGRVQGVGFRYTTEHVARGFEVTGFVRNLPDGRVEILAEGEESVLGDFLRAVCESPMKPYIRDFETHWLEAQDRFKVFGVSF